MSFLPSDSIGGVAVYHTSFQILINGVDVMQLLPPMSMISMQYQDPISFEADTLEVHFEDIGDAIIKNSNIKKGVWMQVKVDVWNKDYIGSHTQWDLGSFMLDQIKNQWPPTQTTLMASSVPIDSQIKLTLQNKVRFAASLQELAATVAKENGLQLVWDVHNNKPYILEEVHQWNESDLSMLSKYCKQNGLAMKIHNGQLIIFDEQEKELLPPVYTIDFSLPGAGIDLQKGELTTQSQDIYSGAQLAYWDPASSSLLVGVAKDPVGTSGTQEQLNAYDYPNYSPQVQAGEDVAGGSDDSGAEGTWQVGGTVPDLQETDPQAQMSTADLAAALLRAKNIKEYKSILTCGGLLTFPNGTGVQSGVVVALKNKGLFDGNWIIQRTTLSIVENKFETELLLRKCIVPAPKGTSVTYIQQDNPPAPPAGPP